MPWANEKVGAGHKTQTTEEFQELQQKTDGRYDGLYRLHVATNFYIKIMSKKTDSVEEKAKVLPLESLANTMKVCGEELGSDSPYGLGLINFGSAAEKIAKAQLEYVSRVRDDFLFGLTSSIEEYKHYQQLKRKLESRRLDYDAKLTKVQKSKKEKPELEEEMRAAKEKYEVVMEDINNKMHALNESEDQYLQELTSFLDAQLEYFKTGHEILENIKKEWVESSNKSPSRRKRTLVRSSTIDSTNSNSDGGDGGDGGDDQTSDNDDSSAHSYSNYSRSRHNSKRTSKLVKSESSNSLNVPSGLSRNKSASSGSSVKSVELKKPAGGTSQKKKVRAIFSYEGEGEDELAIDEGDIITVLEEAEGWWIGEIKNADGTKRNGMFPANYTEEIPIESPPKMPPQMPPRKPTNLSTQTSVEQEELYEEDDDFDEEPPAQAKSSPSISRDNSYTPPARQTSQRRSLISQSNISSQRPGSPAGGMPQIPSRNSKPSPVRNSTVLTSAAAAPRKAARASSYEYSSIGNSIPRTMSPPSVGVSRNSYIPQDYNVGKEKSNENFGPCKECDCDDYSPNVFKKGSCKNCFHIH
ncbi:5128_t:CDS:2 [Funneliformis geosporum]|uniref:4431_t:CDS:1 n=1 Tax=Funneliformis geosporum TaxID=1117311 RepID=A0A9W4WKD4_9GLOM|nr:4431_t:CDS:2 [Funneliformis geosporum]CAI2168698.1 5128_t:CDS:2 [Funneliformis geosporum]